MRRKILQLTIVGALIGVVFWARPGFSQVQQLPSDLARPDLGRPNQVVEPGRARMPNVTRQQEVAICPRQMGMQSQPNGRIGFLIGESFQIQCSGPRPVVVSSRQTLVWDRQNIYSSPVSGSISFETSFPMSPDAPESAVESLLRHALANQKMVLVQTVAPIGGGPARVSELVVQENACSIMQSPSPMALAVACRERSGTAK